MIRLLPILALLGCQANEIAKAERDIMRMKKDVESLTEQVEVLTRTMDKRTKAVDNTVDGTQMPDDYDPDRALPAGDASRPDIIILSIDTLRADHLGAYGYERDTSPFFDELAANGARFEENFAPAPWTLPSHTTMLSGLLPPHHGAIEDATRIGDDIPLVQEAFRDGGYGTIGAVATLFVSKRFGFERGFDFFHDFDIQGAKMNNASTVDAEHVFGWATHLAQEQPENKPLFVFLHVYDAHYGYNAPAPFNEKFDRAAKIEDPLYNDYHHYKKQPLSDEEMAHQIAQYDEEIAYVDHAFRTFVENWRGNGRDAIVIITSDHGEEFGERGSWGHAHTLYREQLHVPLIVNGPGIRKQVVRERTGGEDLPGTMATLGGIAFPNGDGTNLARLLRKGGSARRGVSAQFAETSRFQTLKYRWFDGTYDMYADLDNANRKLCNIRVDPFCLESLYADNAERGDQMFTDMMNYLGEPWEARAAGRVTVEGGFIYQEAIRQHKKLNVKKGDRFSVHPPDAKVSFTGVKGLATGPWAAIGFELPTETAPIKFHGRRPTNTIVNLTDSEKEMLEALGYIQD